MKSLPFYIIQNNECFELLDSLLASTEPINDEKTMKEKNALDKCVEILEASGYRMGFSHATLKCFKKQMLVSWSTTQNPDNKKEPQLKSWGRLKFKKLYFLFVAVSAAVFY